ncbi:MAG: low molecular weight phosphotyrosine protein phosphatase [Pseudomonadota bacterium]|nr:low molecular weight phosphotyrosine protein phosphatase [Pseudomonadota bacterium]
MKLLIVCLGNICRSPMAEGWLRDHIARDPVLRGRVTVDSAGLGDWHAGEPPDPRAISTAATHGIDISTQRARMLTARDFEDFDLILCADDATLREARARMPATSDTRLERLLQWAGLDEPCDLDDPYTGDLPRFERAWKRIEAAGEGIMIRLRGALDA